MAEPPGEDSSILLSTRNPHPVPTVTQVTQVNDGQPPLHSPSRSLDKSPQQPEITQKLRTNPLPPKVQESPPPPPPPPPKKDETPINFKKTFLRRLVACVLFTASSAFYFEMSFVTTFSPELSNLSVSSNDTLDTLQSGTNSTHTHGNSTFQKFGHWGDTTKSLISGLGVVTTDGLWPEDPEKRNNPNYDVKILGFTDKTYLPVAKVWYKRLADLGYTEHYVVAHDKVAYNALVDENVRVIPCIIENPDYNRPVLGLWQQIMSARLHLTRDLLRNGTHLLITDVDNVYSRYVPMYGFVDEGYDVIHAYEMRYPVHISTKFGFVVCSGHQFLRASPATLRFMDLVLKKCGGKGCDDQVKYNEVFFHQLNIQWDNITNPNHEGALRVISETPGNTGLLVQSVTGRSPVTNHTVKIWDRDFAWRLRGDIPDRCPSRNNWVGMPTSLPEKLVGSGGKVSQKLALFEIWDKYCPMTYR